MTDVNTTLGYVLNNDQQRLVEENWEFATGVARGYAGGCVPMAELESEAWTALCKAAFKYKKVEGCKFTSYSYYFIRGSILKLFKNESERRAVEVCSVAAHRCGQRVRVRSLQRLWRESSMSAT